MVDERTKEYVKYLGVGSLPQCEKNKRLLELQNRIIEPNKGNFILELSPDYNPNTGMLEASGFRPVRVFDDNSANAGRVATKWVIKD
jgi:hypothetical protein